LEGKAARKVTFHFNSKGFFEPRTFARGKSMKIRQATRRDRSEWKRLRGELWPNITDRENNQEMESYLQEEGRLRAFLAERTDGSLAGFVEVSMRPAQWDQPSGVDRRIGYLEGLFVHPDDRRSGTALALVRVAEQWARSHGARRMGSDTHPKNRASRAFHSALGYRELERLIVFEKRLR
jgi:aminoglycoside 6'-N-acetyltransferase I